MNSLNKIEQCVEDVLADLERQGHLSVEDVQLLLDLHRLDGSEIALVYKTLSSSGVTVGELASNEVVEPKLPNDASSGLWARRTRKTSIPTDSLESLFHTAGRFRLLNQEEEVLLGRRIHLAQELQEESNTFANDVEVIEQIKDGKRAHDLLVLANLRLVLSIAQKYHSNGLEQSDLIQEGIIGLMRAATKYDHTLGYKFSTYATWWIRQAIHRAMADKGRVIRLPVHVNEKLQSIHKSQNRLANVLNRKPTLRELAEDLDMDIADVKSLIDISREVVSLDASVQDDIEGSLGALINPYADDIAEEVVAALTSDAIRNVMEKAHKIQSETSRGALAHGIEMLKLRYGFTDGEEYTLEEIGSKFGVTRERARQIINRTLDLPEFRDEVLNVGVYD